tara:strand:+ start:1104 stop:1916 length:813 start_codon:yes stop_codon:yes gene_type:complete
MKKLEHLSVLTISGDDASEFLQGQMTQSTDALNDKQIHLTSFCNPQGRVIATALIQLWNKAYYLILCSDLIDDLTNHLSRYILRSNVILSKNEFNAFGIYKKAASAIVDADNQFLRSLANDDERFVLLSNEYEGNDTIGKEDWILKDIKSGIPIINKINSLEYIPQMLNLDHLEGINFSKGCYTGQEVIARVQHRGKVKQRLYRVEAKTDKAFEPKDEIEHMGKKVGNVLISSTHNNICHALVVINVGGAEKILSIDGITLKIKKLFDSH